MKMTIYPSILPANKTSMTSFIKDVFLLIILVLLFVTLCDAVHVKMTNDIGPDIPLTVHCKSKDDDLSTHVIPFNGE